MNYHHPDPEMRYHLSHISQNQSSSSSPPQDHQFVGNHTKKRVSFQCDIKQQQKQSQENEDLIFLTPTNNSNRNNHHHQRSSTPYHHHHYEEEDKEDDMRLCMCYFHE